jgi:hypothetical protein
MQDKIRGFSSVIDTDADGNYMLSPSGTPLNETCDWIGCTEIWAVKLWRAASLNEKGLATRRHSRTCSCARSTKRKALSKHRT